MSYVINLKRRTDRLNKFINNYNILGPNISLTVIEATSTQYNSHILCYEKILSSDLDYGIIFEDDTLFREDGLFKRQWKNIINDIHDNTITYLGMGDCLPIHLPMPSNSLLKALEKSHITNNGNIIKSNMYIKLVNDNIKPFNYIISKNTAKYLLDISNNYQDIYSLLNNLTSTATSKLLTYNLYDIYDTDIHNTFVHTDLYNLSNNFDFTINVYIKHINDSDIQRCIDSINDHYNGDINKLNIIMNNNISKSDFSLYIDSNIILLTPNWNITLLKLFFLYNNFTNNNSVKICSYDYKINSINKNYYFTNDNNTNNYIISNEFKLNVLT